MNYDTIWGLYCFANQHHSGQWSRGYRLLSRITQRYRPQLGDRHEICIIGTRHDRRARGISVESWEEWTEARRVYRAYKRKYGNKV